MPTLKKHKNPRNLSLDDDLIHLRIAKSFAEHLIAYKLLYQVYLSEGYVTPNSYGLRLTPHLLAPSTLTLLTDLDHHLSGTLSLVSDSELGLPLDALSTDLDFRENRRVVEFSSLAVEPSYRNRWRQILGPLFAFGYFYSKYHLKAERIVIGVNPKHARFYSHLLRFELFRTKAQLVHPSVNDHPCVIFYKDLDAKTDHHFDLLISGLSITAPSNDDLTGKKLKPEEIKFLLDLLRLG